MAIVRELVQQSSIKLSNKGTSFEKVGYREIIQSLRNRYSNKREWVLLEELTFPRGTRADVFVLNCFYSKRFKRIAFEIKISRNDFLHELKDPEKRKSAVEYSHEFYFVTPKGMLDKKDIPQDCGLMEISKDGGTRIKIKPPKKVEQPKITSGFLSLLLRNATGWRDDKNTQLGYFYYGLQRILEGFPRNLF
jgi:hypothetical protein